MIKYGIYIILDVQNKYFLPKFDNLIDKYIQI